MDKKTMEYNFEMLLPRIIDSLSLMDLEKAKDILKKINGNCLCIGSGGSSSVSLFASKVLTQKNDIYCTHKDPRDILYMELKHFQNLLAVTYSNKNHGVDIAIKKATEKGLNCYCITAANPDENNISYKGRISKEQSFISIASAIIPMTVLLAYYFNCNKENALDLIADLCIKNKNNNYDINSLTSLFEIMSGDNTYVAAKTLETTIVEAGLGMPIIHEKYNYCHGRSTLSYHKDSTLIYLVNNCHQELDQHLLENIGYQYKNVKILKSSEQNKLVGEFDLTLQSLFLCKQIAKQQGKDLSKTKYSPVVKKLYYYEGDL